MQIIIRGQKVKTQLVAKSLAHIIKDTYKPTFLVSFWQILDADLECVINIFVEWVRFGYCIVKQSSCGYATILKSFSQKKGIKIIFGYNTKSKEHYGLMMYHKNRLIKAYERVACQRKVRIVEFV